MQGRHCLSQGTCSWNFWTADSLRSPSKHITRGSAWSRLHTQRESLQQITRHQPGDTLLPFSPWVPLLVWSCTEVWGQLTGEEMEQKPAACCPPAPCRLLNASGGNRSFHSKISSEMWLFHCNWHMNYILDEYVIESDVEDFLLSDHWKSYGVFPRPSRIKVWKHPLKSAPKFNSRQMWGVHMLRAPQGMCHPGQRLHPSLRHIRRPNLEMFDSTFFFFFARIAYN